MAVAVSTEWKNAIQGQFRFPAYIKMSLKISPPDLRAAAVVSSENTESITNVGTVINGISESIEPVASFEPDRWIGDGSMYLSSQDTALNAPMEWWSDKSPRVSLVFIFNKEYTIPGVSILWDTETNSWPSSFTLQGYDFDNNLIGTYTITDADAVETYTDTPFESVKKVVLTINSWNKPGWRVRITEVLFGLVLNFSNNSISDAKLHASCDLLSAELPSLNVQFNINNYDRTFDPMLVEGYSKYLTERQKIDVQWGFSTDGGDPQWLPAWPMYLSEWEIPTDSPYVSISATSRLSFLDTIYTKGTYTGNARTFADLASTVLQDSNIIKDIENETPWKFAEIMQDLKTRAPAPLEAVNVILQLIANAVGCILDNDPRNNYIRFRESCEEGGYTISKLQQMGDPSFEISDRLKSIQVGLRTFVRRDESEQVYHFEGVISGTITLDISYGNDVIVMNPAIQVTGATVVKFQPFARRAFVTLSASTSGAAVTIVINGYVVDESTTFVTTYNDSGVSSGIEVTIDNPLITEMETLQVVAKAAENFYLHRKKVTIPYTGYPELEVGDTLDYKTNYGDFSADTSELSLDFNGGFSGTLVAHIREDDD